MTDETSYPPSGCARCGHREYCHWLGRPRAVADASGSHAYEHPTNEQIKTRMLARRAARHHDNPRGTTVNGQPEPPTPLDHATSNWHETNLAIAYASGHGNPPDPYRYAALLDARAGWFDHLGHLADKQAGTGSGGVRDVYAIACTYAAELDRQSAAEVRFRHRIPTLYPGAEATRLGLDGKPGHRCEQCWRPWQINRDGACEACPDLMWGITPHSHDEAASYPPGQPWEPVARYPEDDE